MALTREQRAELEALGPVNVRATLDGGGPGRGAAVPGFKTGSGGSGDITRSDIEDWLVEKQVDEARKQVKEAAQQRRMLRWTIATVIIGALAIAVALWPDAIREAIKVHVGRILP